ncbi:uncharacterized protein LOC104445598 [Eucalyptus grandis]|uniref:Uncharacterized protein n=3 Tax=Eucalyptus TaxID=3932 RepID=A0ACC3L0U5_EUCGR|nr:uncharacterized protein LOC104445598 [Eucalyptus grandis]KAK3432235.1 hypothetical protein EUGRSUZ_E03871 [Eucalyptus grandis]
MAELTRMLIEVNLQCSRCCKKIHEVLCKITHIRDRIYNEKQNTVLISVCCSPEKIKRKIICKGGKTVQSVEILPKKPKTVRFNLPPKETAKQPAPALVPELRRKAHKAHPQKAP